MTDDISTSVRRLPVYLLLDCSGSMAGEPIEAMQMGLKTLLSDLRNNPLAMETVWVSVLAFSNTAEVVVPLTEIQEFATEPLVACGASALGEAIELLDRRIREEVRQTTLQQKGDWKPLVFIFTDGEPTDDWQEAARKFREQGRAVVVVCGAGPEVNDATLRQLSDRAVRLSDTQPGTLGAFINWVSTMVTTTSQIVGARAGALDAPGPLPEAKGIHVVK